MNRTLLSALLVVLALSLCGCGSKYSRFDPKFEVEKTETMNGADVQGKYKYIGLIWYDGSHSQSMVSTLNGEVIIETGPAVRHIQGPFTQVGKWPIPKSVYWVRPTQIHWTDASGQSWTVRGSEMDGPSMLLSTEPIPQPINLLR